MKLRWTNATGHTVAVNVDHFAGAPDYSILNTHTQDIKLPEPREGFELEVTAHCFTGKVVLMTREVRKP